MMIKCDVGGRSWAQLTVYGHFGHFQGKDDAMDRRESAPSA